MMTRRETVQWLAALGITSAGAFARVMDRPYALYELPAFGDVTLLYSADLHAQLRPHRFMEPPNLLPPRGLAGQPGYLAGRALLAHYGIQPGTLEAHLFSSVDFAALSQRFGLLGGGAYLGSLIRQQRQQAGTSRTLVLDGGDTWTNSGISLLTQGQAVVDWMNLVGFDHMVFHWEYTLGRARVETLVEQLKAQIISFNIVDDLFGDPIYPASAVHQLGGYAIGVIGSTFPYIKVSHPEAFTEGLSFVLREPDLQKEVDHLRQQGVDAVVLLSHNGVPLDSSLARRIRGIDLILSAHTHDFTPQPVRIGQTWLVAAGSAGKALARIDLKMKKGGLEEVRLRALPVAAQLIQPDPDLVAFVEDAYAPHRSYLDRPLATTQTLLYKRDTLYSTFDELVGRAVQALYPQVEVAFSPATRWGTTLLPGETITMDHLLAYAGSTYPELYLFTLRGEQLQSLLEDVAANVFNPDPLYQQGGDMSRAVGLSYELASQADTGQRIRNVQIGGRPLDSNRNYTVASYGGRLQRSGTLLPSHSPRPIYDVLAEYLGQVGSIEFVPQPGVRVLDQPYTWPDRNSGG